MDTLIILVAGVFGAISTFYLNNKLQLGGVLASSLIAVIAGGLFHFFPALLNENLTVNIPLVIMGASFNGMATNRVIKRFWIIGVSGLIFSILYLLTGSFFDGFGGSLGTMAAISIITVYSIDYIRKKLSPSSI
ncbi:hypothetical protein [Christiangramia echinicola]|uniref:hypothetical protein n=1 Tax=Christiangramia echinicola TaxID=279359 RepID=UPI000425D91F|nr:hypothetical protein [Christiangramia echinicola]